MKLDEPLLMPAVLLDTSKLGCASMHSELEQSTRDRFHSVGLLKCSNAGTISKNIDFWDIDTYCAY